MAQFQSSMAFEATLVEMLGKQHRPLVGRILVSDEDKNWDSIRELWEMNERLKKQPDVTRAFEQDSAAGVLAALGASEGGRRLLGEIDAYKVEYGNKSMYAHEYLYPTWREIPRRLSRHCAAM